MDASVLANALGEDEDAGYASRSALREGGDLTAPDLVDVETLAVLRKRWRAGTLTEQRLETAVADLERLDVERVGALRLIRRAHELRATMTAHDAMYVALAETLGCELLTADRRLAGANGPRCAVRLLT